MSRIVVLLVLVAGCGHTLNTARQVTTAAARFQTQAIAILERVDREYQLSIAREATPPEDRERRLADYRRKRGDVERLIGQAQALTHAAPVLIDMVDHGLKPEREIDAMLTTILEFTTRIRAALASLWAKHE